MKFKDISIKLFLHFVLVLGATIMLFPFLWMIFTSLKPATEILSSPPTFFPHSVTLSHFKEVLFGDWPFIRFFINSIVLSTISTVCIIFTSSLAGYIFAKFEFIGKRVLFWSILGTMMIPFQSFIIPLYLLMNSFGWVDSYIGIVFPWLIQGFSTFFMRQNIASIPDELIDSAKVDGASNLTIYFRIILPLSKSALSAVAIFSFMFAMGYFIWPLIITSSTEKYVLTLGLTLFQHSFYTDYGLVMAGATITTAPVFIAYAVLRRRIIRGMTLTGLK